MAPGSARCYADVVMSTVPLLLILALAQAAPSQPAPPTAREIAPDTYLVPGAMLPDRGPDGNTVIVVAPAGLIVIDTGRHPWHSDGILDFARRRRLPVSAIVNTHWHLDHSSGNGRVKAAHPAAKVYTTRAVDRALAPGGFLVRNLAAARERPPEKSAARREETDLFMATMEARDGLRPDVAVDESGTLTLAGRPLTARVAVDAVTDADLWLYDEASGVAVIGDLVTLPAPFFETACPGRWQDALDEVWATPFRLAVPGHGAPMTRGEFDTYRKAFGAFRACGGSDRPAAACAAGWTKDVGPLLGSDGDRRQATDYATYYVDFLRKNGGAGPDCRAK
jgi:glyoxylase-like metal-dependent hydrolase (beta-lactamase superfamily II)